jgi:hypothetical protein
LWIEGRNDNKNKVGVDVVFKKKICREKLIKIPFENIKKKGGNDVEKEREKCNFSNKS